MVLLLLRFGANASIADHEGHRALHWYIYVHVYVYVHVYTHTHTHTYTHTHVHTHTHTYTYTGPFSTDTIQWWSGS